MDWKKLIPDDIYRLYKVYNFNHAAEILSSSEPEEYLELLTALRDFRINITDIKTKGGNESEIPRKFSSLLRPLGWSETRIESDLIVKLYTAEGKRVRKETEPFQTTVIEKYIDGHNIDFLKNRVACDMEWNSKDQTFDRDLYAFRAYHECNVISAGVIITRSEELNKVFSQLGPDIKKKYGASTTWEGKLLYRLNARRHGGCPILVFAIKPDLIIDWNEE